MAIYDQWTLIVATPYKSHWANVAHMYTPMFWRREKTPAHTINFQSLMTSVSELQVADITPVWHLSITKSRLVRSRPINRNVIPLQQFLLAIIRSQTSSSSFSGTVPRPITLPNVERLKKLFENRLNNYRMWTNAQRHSRPAEYRWRPLFNAAKFGWRPLLECVQ